MTNQPPDIRRFAWDGSSQPSLVLLEALGQSSLVGVSIQLPPVYTELQPDWEEIVASNLDNICTFAGFPPQPLAHKTAIITDIFGDNDSMSPIRRQYRPLWSDQTIGELVTMVVAQAQQPKFDMVDDEMVHCFYVPLDPNRLLTIDAIGIKTEPVQSGLESASPIKLDVQALIGRTDVPDGALYVN